MNNRDYIIIFLMIILGSIIANLLWQKDIQDNTLPFPPKGKPDLKVVS